MSEVWDERELLSTIVRAVQRTVLTAQQIAAEARRLREEREEEERRKAEAEKAASGG
jgi:hypothetical protein